MRALVEREIAELLQDTVGPITYGDTNSVSLPIEVILTSAADRDATEATLEAELAGGTPTGFDPVRAGDDVMVTFVGTVVHATVAG